MRCANCQVRLEVVVLANHQPNKYFIHSSKKFDCFTYLKNTNMCIKNFHVYTNFLFIILIFRGVVVVVAGSLGRPCARGGGMEAAKRKWKRGPRKKKTARVPEPSKEKVNLLNRCQKATMTNQPPHGSEWRHVETETNRTVPGDD